MISDAFAADALSFTGLIGTVAILKVLLFLAFHGQPLCFPKVYHY